MDAYHPDTLLLEFFSASEPLIIFDIGACEGESSVFYQQLFKEAHLFAFEPVPDNFSLAQRRTSSFPNIQLFDLALSKENGTATFHLSSGRPDHATADDPVDYGNKSSSLLPPDRHTETHQWLKFETTLTVQTQRLDDFCQQHNISSIDFIHIDVQGAELMVFEGAPSMMRAVKCIWMEVEEIELYKNQPLRPEVERFMQKLGFLKYYDTVGSISGDQFYVQRRFFIAHKGYMAYLGCLLHNQWREVERWLHKNTFYQQAMYYKNRIFSIIAR
ncbi:MAG: FkbM family methyltransferase [Bernardetiaceae bacterium]